ncbi:MAG: hydantoinase/oxoprolinase family protein [Candidatus Tectomicrobia bacterium]|nr:hydantoinase/oxoprolinase family protein [Candidatus Tectomicrobia bacterium]
MVYHIGIDIGGTFTDIILLNSETGESFRGKVLTTPHDPSVGAAQSLQESVDRLRLSYKELGNIIHGTTLVANALIERKGVRTGLITSAGFRDTLEIARENRYDLYDIFLEMPPPLVPRSRRKEVAERLDHTGRVLTPLDEAGAEQAVKELLEEEVQAIAVVFLHSFRNPAHELAMRGIITRLAPNVAVSLSVEVMPEIREYDRTSTTAANAYTQPIMERYIDRLIDTLRGLGFAGRLYVMLSSGGITTPETASRYPVRVLESGPAAGAIAAAYYARQLALPNVISFDMGGTTAKTCLVKEGKPHTTSDFEVAKVYRFKKGSGLPIKLPVIEMIEIGAGGGSIAHIDKMGLLKVGPESSGSDPGPACYGLGGTLPTVTDADLVLGYLDPNFFLGGEMKLDLEGARAAIERHVAQPLGLDLVRAAWGIHQIVNENMANASRIHAVEQGEDPKAYAMMAFGGAGPVHAYGVTRKLGMRQLICPLGAGVLSAFGFLVAPISFDLVRTHMGRIEDLDLEAINALYEEMERQGTELLLQAGVPRREVRCLRTCDMRYRGQGFEVPVPIPAGVLRQVSRADIRRNFDATYEKLYHRLNPDADVEGVSWRVLVTGPDPRIARPVAEEAVGDAAQAIKGERLVFFEENGGHAPCRVYDRYKLGPGLSFRGPAVVEERESTVVIGPGAAARVDENLNLILDLP